MDKVKKSGSAILMDIVIDIAVVIFIVCFYFYYSGKTNSAVVLYTGVVFFTIVYQLWLRLLFGKINNKLKIRYDHPWFKEKAFERKLYDKLNVKSWKDKVPTFNPELFVMKERSLDEIATSMAKVEVDHLVNVLITNFYKVNLEIPIIFLLFICESLRQKEL